MKLLQFLFLFVLSFVLSNCSVEPVPINYGQDACYFCKMNIVDRQHAAEVVTTKGKAYKFDAIECMMQNLHNWSKEDIAFYLITDYSTPAKLVDARLASYLISPKLPSPMGANLTGFESDEMAKQVQKDKGGAIFTWIELEGKYEQ